MISPIASLYPWLSDLLGYSVVRGCEGFTRDELPHNGRPRQIDCRHLQTRVAALRCLHDVEHSRPWALGQPWSPLTDEQAGRATAEILRAVGEDPSNPAGVVPIAILDDYEDGFSRGKRHFRRRLHEALWHNYLVYHQFQIHEVFEAPHQEDGVSIGWHIAGVIASTSKDIVIYGPEIGDAGRLAADNAARALGCLMIEDLTP